MLLKLTLRPGIDKSSTNYASEGGWFACDKVRFRYGMPEKIGGWVKYATSNTFSGTARSLFNWVTVDNKNLLGIGTNIRFYVEFSGTYYDITPYRATTTLGADPLAATEAAQTLRVTHPGHGAVDGDAVVLSGAAGFAGIPAESLNATFNVIVVDADTYTIGVSSPARATAAGGGSAVVASFVLSTGVDVAVPGRGWNAGRWARGAWGSRAEAVQHNSMRMWSQDSFGEDLVFCTRDGRIYYWDYSEGFNKRAVPLTDLPAASNVPVVASKILLSPQDRHMFAFACNPLGATAQDPLLVRWCDRENIANWTPAYNTTAGELRLSSGNKIVTAIRLKQEILTFTDGSIFAIQLIGGNDVFGMFPVADNISIVSPNAVIAVGNRVLWMGQDKFYGYGGSVQTLPCSLMNHVFDNINLKQADKFFAGANEGFSEVWWFYCSAESNEIDRYVIFNYDESTWAYGTMRRTAWLDSSLKASPVAADGGTLYFHERGVDDDRNQPIHAWIESSDIDIGDGDHFSFVRRLIPDVSFSGSAVTSPSVEVTVTPRSAPGSSYAAGDSSSVVRTSTVHVEQFTSICHLRLRGRQLQLRFESSELGVQWRLGAPRIDIQPDGRK
jgi:hypothetical protein